MILWRYERWVVMFSTDWTQPDHDNKTFTESDLLVNNPTIDSMLPADRGNAIFREVFGF